MLPRLCPSSVSRRWSFPLVLLCAVQSLERFAFLAMMPMFVLYANDRHGIPAPTALLVLSTFTALSYVGGLPAGWLADRTLGVRASALLGAALLSCGYGALALDHASLMWPALGLMVVGHSFFKTGLHALIGRVTTSHERERAFLWNYLAANLGYIAGGLFGEWAHAHHGWSSLFGGAGAAVAVGVALLVAGMSGWRRDSAEAHTTSAQSSPASASQSMRAVWLLCGVAVVFWLTAQQAGSSLTVFAATNTSPQVTALGVSFQVGPGHFASLHGLIVLAMLPAFLMLQKPGQGRSTTGKMLWGYVATSAAFVLMAAAGLHGGDSGRVSGAWLVGCYGLLSLAELLLAPLGVALVTRLAPKAKAAQAVGLWFAGCAVGNGLAGALGLCWERWPHHRYFALVALLSLGAVGVLLLGRRRLDALTESSAGIPSRPELDGTRTMPPTIRQPAMHSVRRNAIIPCKAHRLLGIVLPSLAIVLPSIPVFLGSLPLPVRGVSAITCGLAVLLCCPYLVSHVITCFARRISTRGSARGVHR